MKTTETLIPKLKKTGLSDKEAIVYAYLLELGGSYPSTVAEKAKLNRSTVYKVLTELSIKGLVNEIQKGKKLYYQVEKPLKLLKYTERRVEFAKEDSENVKKLYPELEGFYSALTNKPRILYFDGREGVLSIYSDHIAEDKPYEMLGFANTVKIQEFLGDDYFKKYKKRKEQIGITTRGILPGGVESDKYSTEGYGDVSIKTKPDIRFIPEENFPFKGEITIYGKNKVSIMNLDGRNPTGIIIEDLSLHEMMKTIFNLAWRGADIK